jgi:hypothetical protein
LPIALNGREAVFGGKWEPAPTLTTPGGRLAKSKLEPVLADETGRE